MTATSTPFLSIVVPVYREEEAARPLYETIRAACSGLGQPYEVVFVDDGSDDGTFEILARIQARDSTVRVVRFRKNCGQTAAMAAGFEHARGEIIVSMDGDLQNDPRDIPMMLGKIDEGYDVVCGWRKNRQDKLLTRRVPSVIANWIIGKVTGVPIHDNGCSLKAYRAEVIKRVNLYNEMHRFIPAMSTLAGARIAEVVVDHHARKYGQSKYGLSRVWRVCLDIVTIKTITSFAVRPALWFGILSVPAIVAGAVTLALALQAWFDGVTGRWLVLSSVGLLAVFLGAHLLSLGVLGELFVRTGDFSPRRMLVPRSPRIEVSDERRTRD